MSRTSPEFSSGLEEFIRFAEKHSKEGKKLYCPCNSCHNHFMVDSVKDIRLYVYRKGFDPRYLRWKWHGELENPCSSSYTHNEQVEDDIHDIHNLEIEMENELGATQDVLPDQVVIDEERNIVKDIRLYVYRKGFDPRYLRWKWHGELENPCSSSYTHNEQVEDDIHDIHNLEIEMENELGATQDVLPDQVVIGEERNIVKDIRLYVYRKGFDPRYLRWKWHGELENPCSSSHTHNEQVEDDIHDIHNLEIEMEKELGATQDVLPYQVVIDEERN
ncbi:unnamed protein product, partial [Cuscuta campestris]